MIDLKTTTIDTFVTQLKLSPVAVSVLHGFTQPEGFPFVVVLAVGKPGNERLLELTEKYRADLEAAGSPQLARADDTRGWAAVHHAAEAAKRALGENAPTMDLIAHMLKALKP